MPPRRLPFLAVMALAAGLALPAASGATDITQMTEAERAAFGAQVRAYLLEQPEVLMEAIGILEKRKAEQAATSDADRIAANLNEIYNDGASWVGGSPGGSFTMVEFLDYRCAYCRKSHGEVADLLAVDDDLRIIVKEFPILGEQSLLGSKFALAVLRLGGDDAYKTVSDTLMMQPEPITREGLRALADELKLDPDALFAEMDNPEIDRIIADNRELAKRLNISGTPSFVFGTQLVRGYVPQSDMLAIIDAERGS